MRIKDYKGPSGALRESEWLSSEDLPQGKDITLSIVRVVLIQGATFAGGRKKDGGALELQGRNGTKLLLLNGTNRKTLIRLYGADTEAWWGKPITLYVDPTVQFGGKTVSGVRIRDVVAAQHMRDAEQLIGDDDGGSDEIEALRSEVGEFTPDKVDAALDALGLDNLKGASADTYRAVLARLNQ